MVTVAGEGKVRCELGEVRLCAYGKPVGSGEEVYASRTDEGGDSTHFSDSKEELS